MEIENKCLWLARELFDAGASGISFRDLDKHWLNSDLNKGEKLSRKTFFRWKEAVERLFDVVIVNERCGDYRYKIENLDDIKHGSLSAWLLDAYTTVDALTENRVLRNRIITDEVPSSQNHLVPILEAMKAGRRISFSYKSFRSAESHVTRAESYCLKMFGRRWFLLARNAEKEGDVPHLYGLDRIEGDVTALDEPFTLPSDFDARAFFDTFFGVALYADVPVQRIVLRAYRSHPDYMRSLPLHKSQRELTSCDDYTDFELTLRPTGDFEMELMKFGDLIEVLEPKALRNGMRQKAWAMVKRYKSDN